MGGKFYEPWGKGQLATGKVLKVVPNQSIKFSWHEKYWEPGQKTICEFSLKEKNGKIVLTVTHSGWETFSDPKAQGQMIEGFKRGWDGLLAKLASHF